MKQSKSSEENLNQISVNSAKAWRNEAEAINRSESHLNKIDRVLSESPTEKINNKEVINIGDRDLKAMRKDHEEFKQKQSQAQNTKQKEGESIKSSYDNSYSSSSLKY